MTNKPSTVIDVFVIIISFSDHFQYFGDVVTVVTVKGVQKKLLY